MINFIFSLIYLLVLIGIAIIDKKEHKISKKILLVGFIVEAIQIIYLYVSLDTRKDPQDLPREMSCVFSSVPADIRPAQAMPP